MKNFFLRYWLPFLMTAVIVLTLTSLPADRVPSWQIPYIDKIVHFVMYLALSLTLARALTGKIRSTVSWPRYARRVIFSVFVILIFGAIDEWHQQFIPGRQVSFVDWCMNALGGVTGALLITRYRRLVLRLEAKKAGLPPPL